MPFRQGTLPIATAANVNDFTQTLALVDGIPPIAGRPGRPHHRPDALLGGKGYDSNPNRDALRKRRILPVIPRKGCPNITDMGKLRYVVEQTFALLHHFKRPRHPRERRTELHDAFVSPTVRTGASPQRVADKHLSDSDPVHRADVPAIVPTVDADVHAAVLRALAGPAAAQDRVTSSLASTITHLRPVPSRRSQAPLFRVWDFAGRLCGGIGHATLASSRWSTRDHPLKIKKRPTRKVTTGQETQQAVSISTATKRGKRPRTAKIHNRPNPC
ncbi:transposase [Streptomyces cyaneofuscatus]